MFPPGVKKRPSKRETLHKQDVSSLIFQYAQLLLSHLPELAPSAWYGSGAILLAVVAEVSQGRSLNLSG
jgi:hypothetical protein